MSADQLAMHFGSVRVAVRLLILKAKHDAEGAHDELDEREDLDVGRD